MNLVEKDNEKDTFCFLVHLDAMMKEILMFWTMVSSTKLGISDEIVICRPFILYFYLALFKTGQNDFNLLNFLHHWRQYCSP